MRTIGLLAAATLMTSPAFGGVVTFTDSTFNNSDWTATSFFSTDYVATQHLTGGNPGAFRYFVETSELNAFVENIYTPGIFNPALMGSITTLAVSYDIAPSTTGEMYELPVLFQGGSYYSYIASFPISTTTWHAENVISGSSADWFAEDGGGTHPHFTSGSAPIQFGVRFSTAVELGGCAPNCAEGGIDNFSVTVTFADTPSATPEPSSFLMVTGCVVLALIGRLRRPHQRSLTARFRANQQRA